MLQVRQQAQAGSELRNAIALQHLRTGERERCQLPRVRCQRGELLQRSKPAPRICPESVIM